MSEGRDNPIVLRPVPRWVRGWAVVTVLLTVLLLALGGFVTSFRVGMADPVWPTEPWFLLDKDWSKLEFGFLVEHTHRLAGWVVGVAVSVLAVAAWWYEPDANRRWLALGSVVLLLVAYGEFHRGMGNVWTEVKERAVAEYGMDPKAADFESRLTQSRLVDRVANWPVASGAATAVLAVLVLSIGFAGTGAGRWVRLAAAWALVFVMAQGLLGGFRVLLHALAGPTLAAVHGAFGQIAFCVVVAASVLAAPRRAGDAVGDSVRREATKLGWLLVGVLLVQLGWAVWLRHDGSSLSQRLHILTAFVATGVGVWLAVRLVTVPAARPLRGGGVHLIGILAVQLLLGVEAYMGKFAATGPQAQMPPMLRVPTIPQATIRTAHQLIGASLLASAVAVALRAGRRPAEESADTEAEPEPVAVAAAH